MIICSGHVKHAEGHITALTAEAIAGKQVDLVKIVSGQWRVVAGIALRIPSCLGASEETGRMVEGNIRRHQIQIRTHSLTQINLGYERLKLRVTHFQIRTR